MTDDLKPDPGGRYWRYQTVRVKYREYPDDPELIIIEVYVNRTDDTLCAWSGEPVGKHPSGETIEELIEDLIADVAGRAGVDACRLRRPARRHAVRAGRDRGHQGVVLGGS